ncbi:hypothetical protein [Streptosporangium sp. NBC_01756]|uniref:hypothetical protein n=1 Tax=Streptosporangium sp. NBC_01756 TaxID=2975950 RepID=UPI002DDC454D|nr:hypothetical protein [Streptosporangium sp. NBC_01756]WSC88074.1 hypothetical protein OIE48_07695 [Streptosporangium sp. NBC_01756]
MVPAFRRCTSEIDAWRGTGPDQSRRVLAKHLSRIADQRLLDVADLDKATRHLTTLICNPPQTLSFFGVLPLAEECTRPRSDGQAVNVG